MATRAAVAVTAIDAVRKAVDGAQTDAARRADVKRMLTTVYRVANGIDHGRSTGPAADPDQPELRDLAFDGPEGATVAWRQRIAPDGRPIRELAGLGENDAAAGRQAAEALGRTSGVPVPGLEVYGDRPAPAATVDDRTAVLETREAVANTQTGLSTGPQAQRTTEGGLGAKSPTGSRIQPTQETRTR